MTWDHGRDGERSGNGTAEEGCEIRRGKDDPSMMSMTSRIPHCSLFRSRDDITVVGSGANVLAFC